MCVSVRTFRADLSGRVQKRLSYRAPRRARVKYGPTYVPFCTTWELLRLAQELSRVDDFLALAQLVMKTVDIACHSLFPFEQATTRSSSPTGKVTKLFNSDVLSGSSNGRGASVSKPVSVPTKRTRSTRHLLQRFRVRCVIVPRRRGGAFVDTSVPGPRFFECVIGAGEKKCATFQNGLAKSRTSVITSLPSFTSWS
jgi:hypothetical protein